PGEQFLFDLRHKLVELDWLLVALGSGSRVLRQMNPIGQVGEHDPRASGFLAGLANRVGQFIDIPLPEQSCEELDCGGLKPGELWTAGRIRLFKKVLGQEWNIRSPAGQRR